MASRKTKDKTVIRALGLGGLLGGSSEGVVDVKDGKIVRVRPFHYDWKYNKEEVKTWKMEKNGKTFEQPLSELSKLMTPFPQILINVPVERKPDISGVREVAGAIKQAEQGMGENGRVLVRYSGTEPVCRVMVEGEKEDEARAYAGLIADRVREVLGE